MVEVLKIGHVMALYMYMDKCGLVCFVLELDQYCICLKS